MRIEIGSILKGLCNSKKRGCIALNIPSLGVLEAEESEGFSYIDLSKKQMIKLKNKLETLINEQ